MTPPNFTLQDLRGIAVALPMFAAILFCPGFLLLAAGDRFFRPPPAPRRAFAARCAWSVALSFAITPLLTLTLGRLLPFAWTANLYWLAALGAVVVAVRERRSLHLPRHRTTRNLALTLAGFFGILVASLVDLQIHARLFVSVSILDQSYRTAFIRAILQTGIPPANPLYFPAHPTPLRYYYGWYALCAVCARLAAVSARQALMASSLWVLAGTSAVCALFGKHFLQVRNVRRFTLFATLLLSVTGLDLLPVIGSHFAGNPFLGDPEWWSVDQITSWFDSILWVPNHTGALLACAVCFLLLWSVLKPNPTHAASKPKLLAVIALAAVSAASAFTLSIYVTFAFAILLLALMLRRLLTRSREVQPKARFVTVLLATAILSLLLLAPFLHQLLATTSATDQRTGTGPTHLFRFSIRAIIEPTLITGIPALAGLNQHHPVLFDLLVRLLLLPLGLALEFGFYALILYLGWRQRARLDPPRRTALFLSLAGIVLLSTVRSAVIGNNDFGYRSALLPSFFLLLLGADFLNRAPWHPQVSAALRRTAATLLVIGLLSTMFQVVALRFFAPWQESHGNPEFRRPFHPAHAAPAGLCPIAGPAPGIPPPIQSRRPQLPVPCEHARHPAAHGHGKRRGLRRRLRRRSRSVPAHPARASRPLRWSRAHRSRRPGNVPAIRHRLPCSHTVGPGLAGPGVVGLEPACCCLRTIFRHHTKPKCARGSYPQLFRALILLYTLAVDGRPAPVPQ